MKKLLALLAVVLCVVSCQTEPEGLDVNVGGEIDAIVNVTIPEVETRAADSDSALGAFKNVDFSKYTIRYILQVYYKGEPSQERLVKYSDDKSVAFDVRLVPGRDYNFVVWADIVADSNYADNQWSNEDGLHYNTTDLHNITLKQNWVAMDETRDAFTATVAVNGYSSASNITVNLQRPFAKLRVVTTDMVALNNLGIVPTKATVTYSEKHYNAFNAFAGEAIANTKNRDIKHEKFDIAVYGDNTDKEMVLFTDYFFAAETDLVKFTLDVFDQNNVKIGETVAFNTDIPVNANYLTTIKGNILTDGKNFNVTIDDAFAGENKWPNTPAGELVAAAMFGGEVTLTENVVLTEPLKVTSELTINLNGKTITTTEKQTGRHHYAIDNYGTLSLVGNGTIIARGVENFGTMTVDGNVTIKNIDSNGGAAIWNEGELTINNGTFISSEGATAGSYGGALNTRPGGKATVNNGTFKTYSNLTYAIINEGETTIYNANVEGKHGAVAGADTATTTIYNGTFKLNGNPDNSDHCAYYVSAIYGGTFSMVVPDPAHGDSVFWESTIAAGYKAFEKDGKFVVVPADADNVVADTTVLAAIKGNENATVYVMPKEDGSDIKLDGKLSMAKGVKLIGMGETPVKLFNDWGSNAFANQAHFTNTHVENINFTNNLVIDAGIANGDVKFVNCVFGGDLAHQGVHFDSGNGTITFENCTFVGRNMFGSSLENVIFNNCTFLNKKSSQTGADKWTGVNMWGKYEFNNCTFDTEAHCNVKCDGVVAAFNNCKYVDNRDIETVINNGQNFNATITF